MGYRSEVVMYFREDVDKYGKTLEQLLEDADKAEKGAADECVIGHNDDGDRILRIKYSWIKWYDSYPLIKYWYSIMEEYDGEDYVFGRLGEEFGDFENLGEYGEIYCYQDYEEDVNFHTPEDDYEIAREKLRNYLANQEEFQVTSNNYKDKSNIPVDNYIPIVFPERLGDKVLDSIFITDTDSEVSIDTYLN